MPSIKLWSVTLPSSTNLLGKIAQTIRSQDQQHPRTSKLELVTEAPFGPHVLIEFEKREDMPSTVMIPVSQVANWVPMPEETRDPPPVKDEPASRELACHVCGLTATERASIRRQGPSCLGQVADGEEFPKRCDCDEDGEPAPIATPPKRKRGRPPKK